MTDLRRVSFALVLTLAVGPLAGSPGATDNWPRFRGADAGIAEDDPALPMSWSATENVAWRIDVPGTGWSSPIVWGDTIYLTSVVADGAVEPPRPGLYLGGERPAPGVDHRWMVFAYDFETGRQRWAREIRRGRPASPRHLKNSYASETPVTDGVRVYVYFGGVGLFAFGMDGTPVWSVEIEPQPTRYGWGTASSPVVHEGRVYILNDNDAQSYLAAYDAATGREVWRVARDEGTNWTTPFVWTHERGAEIVTAGSDRVRSYALDGALLWELRGMSTIAIPTPYARHGLLFVSSGYVGDALRPLYAIRPGARGDITLPAGQTSSAFIAWSHPTLGTYNPTSLVYGDYLYTLLDRGFFMAHDARTGQEIYGRQRIAADAGAFTASPWAYNGRVFALSEEGDTFVIAAGQEFQVLARNRLGEMAMATPAIARGSLIVRTSAALYRIATAR